MPRGFCGRSPHFRRPLPGDGGYSVTYRVMSIRSSVGAAGAASIHRSSINMAMECHLEDNIIVYNIKGIERECGLPAYLLSNFYNTYYTSRHSICTNIPRNYISESRSNVLVMSTVLYPALHLSIRDR